VLDTAERGGSLAFSLHDLTLGMHRFSWEPFDVGVGSSTQLSTRRPLIPHAAEGGRVRPPAGRS